MCVSLDVVVKHINFTQVFDGDFSKSICFSSDEVRAAGFCRARALQGTPKVHGLNTLLRPLTYMD